MSHTPKMPDDDDGVPRDAWLSEALRHAPDADAVPPSALSETILRQARAAASLASVTSVAPRPAASLGQRLLAAWSWLARPPVAAGFASVMVATVVGLMWWDRPLEETLPPRGAPVAAAPTEPAAVAAPTPVPTTSPRAPAATIETRRQAAGELDRAKPVREQPAVRAAPRSQATTPAQMADAKGAAGPVAKRAAEPPTPRAEANRVAASELGGAAAGATADTETASAERRMRSVVAAAKAIAPADAPPAAVAPAPPAAQALRRDTTSVAAPIAALRAAVDAQPERWRWQRAGGAPQPLTRDLIQWLGQLDTQTSSRFRPDRAGELAAAARSEATRDAAAPLQLWLDGRLHSTLRFDATGVVLESAGDSPSRQRAELAAADAAALRAALDQATR